MRPRRTRVGPYRLAAEDAEAREHDREVAAFRASLARHALRVRIGVIVAAAASVVALVAGFAVIVEHDAGARTTFANDRAQRCETHFIVPAQGAPFPMAICY